MHRLIGPFHASKTPSQPGIAVKSLILHLPLNIGAILKTPSPPMVSICPNASSMKNIGIPANMSVRKYGTKNAPPPFL